jgi:hypothetical protein
MNGDKVAIIVVCVLLAILGFIALYLAYILKGV